MGNSVPGVTLLAPRAPGNEDVAFAFPEHASHVFKEDDRTPEEVAASPGTGYNTDATRLDPDSVQAILS